MAKQTSYHSALIKAQNLCANQEKCISDIRTKLYAWKVNPNDHDKILLELQEQKFIDEQRYAISFTKEKFRFSKWGKVKIEYTLRQKNIPTEFISIALEEISESEYDDVLFKELEKKIKSIKDIDEYTIKSKLVRFALSRGFENGKVFDMVSKIVKDKD